MSRAFSQLGLVVHPTRPIDTALRDIREWAAAHDVGVGQVEAQGNSRQVADAVERSDCDLLLAVGGDGTTLTALHLGAEHSRPALGVACGSLGVLTSVTADRVGWALDQFAAGAWNRVPVPALDVCWDGSASAMAINDVSMIRASSGQIIVSVTIDGVLYARVAGDGLVVATALGSTAYTMAAGGPILAPGADGIVVTPLAAHGGAVAPIVAGSASRLAVAVEGPRGSSLRDRRPRQYGNRRARGGAAAPRLRGRCGPRGGRAAAHRAAAPWARRRQPARPGAGRAAVAVQVESSDGAPSSTPPWPGPPC